MEPPVRSLHVKDRIQLLAAPGGLRAGFWKLVRAVTQLDRYEWLSRDVRDGADYQPLATPEAAGVLVSIRSLHDWGLIDPRLREQLDAGSGWGVEPVVSRGARIYAFVVADKVQCQVTIDTRVARINTPCKLEVELQPGECFLSFLVTTPDWQRHGLAVALVQRAMQRLAKDGFRHCHCHVQATNVKSLRTFARAGWVRSGALWAWHQDRLLRARLPPGIAVRPCLP